MGNAVPRVSSLIDAIGSLNKRRGGPGTPELQSLVLI
jgi:hypothetical protein